jgi:PPOX class probable F420-dependent enzyme
VSNPPLPESAVSLLKKPNPAVMSTLRPDGQPVSAATWYLWEDDGRVLLNMDAGRVRLRHLRNDPRVTLTVLAADDWSTHITLIGRIAELRRDEGLKDIDRLAQQYLGEDYGRRDSERFSARLEVERWYGWGNQRESQQPG